MARDSPRFLNGPVLEMVETGEARDFLMSRKLQFHVVAPADLRVRHDDKMLWLQIMNGDVREYPLRQCFILKLLRWYAFPTERMFRFSIETIASVLNDHLMTIKSGDVIVTVENGDALTITSRGYSRMSDLDVLEQCAKLNIRSVSRTDYMLRIYSQVEREVQPVPGDVCGFGWNVFNSETGFRKLSVTHFLLRYICSNGAVVREESGTGRAHYGMKSEALAEFLRAQLGRMTAGRENIISRLTKSASDRIAPDDDGLRKDLARLLGPRGKEIAESLENSPTRYEIFNMITEEARSLQSGRRLQLEEFAGEFLMRE